MKQTDELNRIVQVYRFTDCYRCDTIDGLILNSIQICGLEADDRIADEVDFAIICSNGEMYIRPASDFRNYVMICETVRMVTTVLIETSDIISENEEDGEAHYLMGGNANEKLSL